MTSTALVGLNALALGSADADESVAPVQPVYGPYYTPLPVYGPPASPGRSALHSVVATDHTGRKLG
ncbi:MAG: hypothetical protein LC789_00415 [Actinobacteria bacterium]|nr:hypothetical protein [Actinomycetota bacterium]